MIRGFELIDENSSIKQVENKNEQCDNNESDNIIQDAEFIKLEAYVPDEPYPSLDSMLVLLDMKSEKAIINPETIAIRNNANFPVTFNLNQNLYFIIIN